MGRVGMSLGRRLNGFVNSFANRRGGEIVRAFPDFLYARLCVTLRPPNVCVSLCVACFGGGPQRAYCCCSVCYRGRLDDRCGSILSTMNLDSTPHRIFKISELTGAISRHLVLISPKSAVNFARTCRYIEEPALSTLWETQRSFNTLLKIPLSSGCHVIEQVLVRSQGVLL